MKKIIALVVLWVGCGYVDYGFVLGEFTHEFPWDYHTAFAIEMGLGGPLSLPASLSGPHHHWLTKPYTVEERWQAFHKRWPLLTREEFEQYYN